MNLPVDYAIPPNPLTEDVGHGESVAWLISQYVPNSDITGTSVQPIWSGPKQYHGITTGALLSFALREFLDMDEEKRPAIITLTAGGPVQGGPMDAVEAAVEDAHQMGILVISAIGNDRLPRATYPAAWPTVLAVGATVDGAPAEFNNMYGGPFRSDIDVLAPGRHVVPFVQDPTYGGWAEILGTSFAVPVVAGEVAARCEEYEAALSGSSGGPVAAAKAVLQAAYNAGELSGFIFP
jgi:hypothetical protein